MIYLTTYADGSRPHASSLKDLELECPGCKTPGLAPVSDEDGEAFRADGTERTRWFECGGCRAVVPVRMGLRLGGVLVQPGAPVLSGEDREALAGFTATVFAQAHHPWHQAVDLELGAGHTPFRRLGDLGGPLATEGSPGGGVSCSACGKRALEPVPDPRVVTVVGPAPRVLLPCPQCEAVHLFTYGWDAGAGEMVPEEARDDGARALADAYASVLAVAAEGDAAALEAKLKALPDPAMARLPAFQLLEETIAGQVHTRLDPERCPSCTQPGLKPILRRLGEDSPMYCPACETISCQTLPRVRLHGSNTRGLLGHLKARMQKRGPTAALEDLAITNRAFPFLVKTPPIQPLLALALKGVREELAARGGRVLSVADLRGIRLVDAESGEVLHHLPHMQARDRTCPPALGFVDRKAYYQEPGELSLVAHPLYTGAAWRTPVDGPVIRIMELGAALLVETVLGLSLYSGSSGRVRWRRARDELAGLDQWTLNNGTLVVAGDEAIVTVDPASGEQKGSWDLPKRGQPLRIVHGDLPDPAIVIDQGYGPGIFAPEEESIKGVKPILLSADQAGAPDLMNVIATGGYVYSLWGSSTGFGDRSVVAGPLEKALQGWRTGIESGESNAWDIQIPADSGRVFISGAPMAVLDQATGEALEMPEIDAARGIRRLRAGDGSSHGQPFLCLGDEVLTAVDSADPTRVLWTLEVELLQGVDVPGDSLAAPADLPGGTGAADEAEVSAVGLPDLAELQDDV